MQERAYAMIMAGGKGERFWPLSTTKTPKQLLSVVGGKPLIARTLEYLEGLVPADRVFVITSADIAEPIRRALPGVPAGNVIGEPFGRDTAAAVALGMTLIGARDPGAVFAVLTADHLIRDVAHFRRTLGAAMDTAAAEKALVTIGIQPAFPSTGFGYVEAGAVVERPGQVRFRKGLRFVEKPDRATAEAYVASGDFFWNSGMFIWSVPTLREAFRQHQPALAAMSERLQPRAGGAGFDAALLAEYEKLPKISIDYAVMEKARNIIMAEGAFGWDDIGSWPALANHLPADASGNVVVGACESIDAAGNIVVSEGRLTALIGVKDLVVVHAAGATLICPRDRAQDVKKMVQQIAAHGGHGDLL